MVGFVIVSHSRKLAEGVVELAKMMAPDVPQVAAGGLEDGSFGTSFERILEALDGQKLAMADCPLVEGAVVAAVNAAGGMSFEEILKDLEKVRDMKKLS